MTSASAPILIHSVGRSVVNRVGLGVEVGDFIVSTKVSNDESDNENGKDGVVCCEVYLNETAALARQTTLRALGPAEEVPDPSGLPGFKHDNKFKRCKRKQLVVILGKNKVNDFLNSSLTNQDVADPLIGKQVLLPKMIDFGDGEGEIPFQGESVIHGEIVIHGSVKYQMIATKNGVTHAFTEDKALVKALYASRATRTPPPAIDLSKVAAWTYDVASGGTHLCSLVRTLESSKDLPAGQVCAIEMLDVLEGIEPGSTTGHDLDRASGSPAVSTITDAVLKIACAKLKLQMESEAVKKESYPSTDGTRLGKAIKRVLNGESGAAPKPFPLVELLMLHADSPQEFDVFLQQSYVFTLQSDRWAITKSPAGGG
jgi:hypothetical protein